MSSNLSELTFTTIDQNLDEFISKVWPVDKAVQIDVLAVMIRFKNKPSTFKLMKANITENELMSLPPSKTQLKVSNAFLTLAGAKGFLELVNVIHDPKASTLDKSNALYDMQVMIKASSSITTGIKQIVEVAARKGPLTPKPSPRTTPNPTPAPSATSISAPPTISKVTKSGAAISSTGGSNDQGSNRWNITASTVTYANVDLELTQDLDDELTELLDNINSQDAYDIERASIGPIPEENHMILPDALMSSLTVSDKSRIGAKCVKLSLLQFIQVAALNYESFLDKSVAIRIGILRAFMVEHGYVDISNNDRQPFVSYNEVQVVSYDPSPEAIKDVVLYMQNNKEALSNLQTLAMLAPIFGSEVFLKTGHHYMSDISSNYDDMYDRLFRACLLSDISEMIPKNILFHDAIHWTGPYMARLAWKNLKDLNILPLAMSLRYNVAPAGSALITTTCAILNAIKTIGLYTDIYDIYKDNIDLIFLASSVIKANPTKFFQLSRLYGHAPLTATEQLDLAKARTSAETLCAVCQAFIETIAKDTELNKAKALKKFSDNAIGVKKIVAQWMSQWIRNAPKSKTLKELLSSSIVSASTIP